MESLESELQRITIENCKLKASLKASTYEKEKLLELVKNLLTALDKSDTSNTLDLLKPHNQATSRIVSNNISNTDKKSQHKQPSYQLSEQNDNDMVEYR